jgi:hypothetical protein
MKCEMRNMGLSWMRRLQLSGAGEKMTPVKGRAAATPDGDCQGLPAMPVQAPGCRPCRIDVAVARVSARTALSSVEL